MDLRKLKTLVDLVSASNISELEITEAEGKIRIAKAAPQALAQVVTQMPVAAAPAVAASAAPQAAPSAAPVAAAADAVDGTLVKSPMVGTFYRAASPDGAPFVEVGQAVNKGDVLCIIEAMKILNEIEAEQSGTITQVLGENGEAVEYGQPLFVIK